MVVSPDCNGPVYNLAADFDFISCKRCWNFNIDRWFCRNRNSNPDWRRFDWRRFDRNNCFWDRYRFSFWDTFKRYRRRASHNYRLCSSFWRRKQPAHVRRWQTIWKRCHWCTSIFIRCLSWWWNEARDNPCYLEECRRFWFHISLLLWIRSCI